MSSWLRNIQGQLSDLASEVLQEATEEVEDLGTEIQVERKKCAEAERLLVIERSKTDHLMNQLAELEEQLYSTNLENEACREKFEHMIKDRDLQIKQFQTQLNRLNQQSDDDDSFFKSIELDDTDYYSTRTHETSSARSSSINNQRINSVKDDLFKLKEKHESEISALMSVHNDNIKHIREEYETKIRELQRPASDAGTTDSTVSNNGWVQMGVEASPNVFSSSTGESTSAVASTINDDSKVISRSSSPKGHSISDEFVENESLENLIVNLREKLQESQTNLRKTEALLNDRTKELYSQQEIYQQLKFEFTQLQNSSKDNNALTENLMGKISDFKQELEKQTEQQFKRCEKIETTIDFLEEELFSLNNHDNSLSTDLKTLKTSYNTLLNEKNGVDSALKNSECEKSLLMEKINELNGEIHECDEKMKNLSNLNSSLEEEILQLRLSKENKQNDDEILCNKDKLDSLTIENEELKRTLQTVQKESSQYYEELQINLKKLQQTEEILTSEDELSNLKEQIDQLKLSLDKQKEISGELSRKNSNLYEEKENFKKQLLEKESESLSYFDNLKEFVAKLEESEQKVATLGDLNSSLEEEISRLQATFLNDNEKIDREFVEANEEQLKILKQQNEELTRTLHEKHEENRQYYNSLQEYANRLNVAEEKLAKLETFLSSSEQKLLQSQEEREHLNREVVRLREHLVSMEDISTKEAIAAEERETQLRKEILGLQESSSNISVNTNQTQATLQAEITQLQLQLRSNEEIISNLRRRLNDDHNNLEETKKALANLQNVLRELNEEHAEEILKYKQQFDLNKEENEKIMNKLEEFSKKESELKDDRRYMEDSITLLKEELARKNQSIEELENHLEDLRHNEKHVRGGNSASTSEYKIDDVILKQLFMSYFLAEKDKQPEIALVMASILGYSIEEQNAIRQSFVDLMDNGWFGLGRMVHGAGASKASTHSSPSLTEQFILFLEKESRRVTEQPTLPVTSEPNKIQLNDSIPTTNSSTTQQSLDLKNILES